MDDLEFVQRCVTGDKKAWDEFTAKYSRLIYAYIHGILKIKGVTFSQENIEDLYQEIFLQLRLDNFKKLKSFKALGGCSLASWLRQVVINFTLDYLRKSRALVSLDAENEEDLALKDIISDSKPLARDTVITEEKLLQLKDCIGALADSDRYFLELHLNQRLDLEDVREALGLSRSAVDMRKSRIIERLKDCFKGKGFALDY